MANHCHWELITSGGWLLALAREISSIPTIFRRSNSIGSTSFLSSVLLSMIIVTIVGVAIVAAGIVVESSSVVKSEDNTCSSEALFNSFQGIDCASSSSIAGICILPVTKASSVKVPVAKSYFVFFGTSATRATLIRFVQTTNKTYCSFRTIKVERLTANELFVVYPPVFTTQSSVGPISIDYAASGRLRKLSPEEAWETIEELAQYEEEGWNDPIFLEDRSLNYQNANIIQLLGVMESRVDTLMKDAISIIGGSENVFGISSDMMRQLPPEPSHQEAFADLVMNFILDQKEKVKQLEEYMGAIGSDFMQLPLKVVGKLKEEIRMEENRTKKIEKITRKKCAKNPVELARVKQRQGESTSAYVERYKDECIHVKACPEILKISGPSIQEKPGRQRMQKSYLNTTVTGQSRRQSNDQSSSRNNSYREGGKLRPRPTTNAHSRGAMRWERILLDLLMKNIKEGKDKQRSGGKKDAPRDKADTIYMTYLRTNFFGLFPKTNDGPEVKSSKPDHDVDDWLHVRKDKAHGEKIHYRLWLAIRSTVHNSLDEFNGDQITIRHNNHYWERPEYQWITPGIMQNSIPMTGSPTHLWSKRANGKLRCAWFFTDLNKASPQDAIHYRRIDWKVDPYADTPSVLLWIHTRGIIQQNPNGQGDDERHPFTQDQGVYLLYTKMPFVPKEMRVPPTNDWFQSNQQTIPLPLFQTLKNCTKKELPLDYRSSKKLPTSSTANTDFPYASRTPPGRNHAPAVKGQILADFLIKKPETDAVLPQSEVKLQEPWILFTDGLSCVDGSGAGLILTNLEGMEFTYTLRFEFTATNNEAEYEALIAGLRIAARMV
ncbi:zinc finger, CCHC-type containing protein, partial [Tanacetum coccineum]